MRLNILIITMLLGASLLAGPATAAQWEVDKDHSNVYFAVKHIFSTIQGKFDRFHADVDLDPADPTTGSIRLVIKTGSINTDIDKRDNHLRSADFFESETYPDMTFQSMVITPRGDMEYTVSGDLTIKDKTQWIDVPMTLAGPRDNPLKPGTQVLGVDSRFSIDRLDYGVGDGRFFDMGVLDREVKVTISMELVR